MMSPACSLNYCETEARKMPDNDFVWLQKCPYSKDGKCTACNVLKVTCDGDRFIRCQQYLETSAKEVEKSVE